MTKLNVKGTMLYGEVVSMINSMTSDFAGVYTPDKGYEINVSLPDFSAHELMAKLEKKGCEVTLCNLANEGM